MSSGELWAAVVNIEQALESTAPPRSVVGIGDFEGWRWIAALLAIFKANRIYMPVRGMRAEGLPHWELVLPSDSSKRVELRAGGEPAQPPALPHDAAYVFPTSGSTGAPKWIIGNGRGVERFVRWEAEYLRAGDTDVVSQLTPPTFDPVLRDLFLPLISGGSVAVPPRDTLAADPEATLAWLDATKVTIVHTVPTVMRLWLHTSAENGALRTLRALMLAGEPLFPADTALWRRRFGASAVIVNLYGPSETTLAKCAYRVTEDELETGQVPVGRAYDGGGVIVIDEVGGVCAPFEIGEILIRAEFPSFGYWNDPKRTSERFIRNPFDTDDELRVFRTRDLGYMTDSGDLVLTGRSDDEHKVRGTRVDLSSVEAAIRACPGVRDAAVKVITPDLGPAFIAAYVTGSATLDEARRHVRGLISAVALPLAWEILEELPRTASGKVDRNALPPPTETRSAEANTTTEAWLEDVWRTAMPHAGPISPTDPFRLLGGQSIEAVQIVAEIARQTGTRLSLDEFYELQSIARIAKFLGMIGIESAVGGDAPPIAGRYSGGQVPLSGAQHRFWTWLCSDFGTTRFQFPWLVRVSGAVDADRLRAALQTVIDQSPGQWLAFHPHADGTVGQSPLAGHREVGLTAVRPGSAESQLRDVLRMSHEFAKTPFELGREPLARGAVYSLGDKGAALLMVNHVLASDGRTRQILLARVAQAYAGAEWKPPTTSFLDYAAHEAAGQPTWTEYEPYWSAKLKRLEIPHIPWLVSPPDGIRDPSTATLEWRLGGRVWDALVREFSDDGGTPAGTLLAALTAALARVTNTKGGHVLLSYARRPLAALNEVDGCFTDSVVYLFDADDRFDEHVQRTQRELRRDLEQAVPSFEYLLRRLRPDVDPISPRWFPVIFAPQPDLSGPHLPGCETQIIGGLQAKWIWPVEVYPVIRETDATLRVNFSKALIPRQFVEALGRCMVDLVTRVGSAGAA